jgi:putative DNA methylase
LTPYLGETLTVIAWLWARTVKSPNPAFAHVDVPLVNTFILSSKPGKQSYIETVQRGDSWQFKVKAGTPPESAKQGTKTARGTNFRCLVSQTAIEPDYVKNEIVAGRTRAKLMAIVAEGKSERAYLTPTPEQEAIAEKAHPNWLPEGETPAQLTGGGAQANRYGLKTWASLFTPRQLVALTTFCDLIDEVRRNIHQNAVTAGLADDDISLDGGGTGARAYAEAISVYLAHVVDRSADFWCSLCLWANQPKNELVAHLFTRQALPMAWDFAEANPFSSSGGNFEKNMDYVVKGIQFLPGLVEAKSWQQSATTYNASISFISTDPPYYDNIPYADLSDFFYVWLRRTLRSVFPGLLGTISVPKAEELVATAYRHGTKENAERFFLDGMTKAMHNLALQAHPAAPITIYYAFKQSETEKVPIAPVGRLFWMLYCGLGYLSPEPGRYVLNGPREQPASEQIHLLHRSFSFVGLELTELAPLGAGNS